VTPLMILLPQVEARGQRRPADPSVEVAPEGLARFGDRDCDFGLIIEGDADCRSVVDRAIQPFANHIEKCP
jgi:hypothetical protein